MTTVAPIDVEESEAAVLIDLENIRLSWEKTYGRLFRYTDLCWLCELAEHRFHTIIGRIVVFMSDPKECEDSMGADQLEELKRILHYLKQDQNRKRDVASGPSVADNNNPPTSSKLSFPGLSSRRRTSSRIPRRQQRSSNDSSAVHYNTVNSAANSDVELSSTPIMKQGSRGSGCWPRPARPPVAAAATGGTSSAPPTVFDLDSDSSSDHDDAETTSSRSVCSSRSSSITAPAGLSYDLNSKPSVESQVAAVSSDDTSSFSSESSALSGADDALEEGIVTQQVVPPVLHHPEQLPVSSDDDDVVWESCPPSKFIRQGEEATRTDVNVVTIIPDFVKVSTMVEVVPPSTSEEGFPTKAVERSDHQEDGEELRDTMFKDEPFTRLGQGACPKADVCVRVFGYKQSGRRRVQRCCDVAIGSEVTKICFMARFSSILLFSADSDFEETAKSCAQAEDFGGVIKYAKKIRVLGFSHAFVSATAAAARYQFQGRKQVVRHPCSEGSSSHHHHRFSIQDNDDVGVSVYLIEQVFPEIRKVLHRSSRPLLPRHLRGTAPLYCPPPPPPSRQAGAATTPPVEEVDPSTTAVMSNGGERVVETNIGDNPVKTYEAPSSGYVLDDSGHYLTNNDVVVVTSEPAAATARPKYFMEYDVEQQPWSTREEPSLKRVKIDRKVPPWRQNPQASSLSEQSLFTLSVNPMDGHDHMLQQHTSTDTTRSLGCFSCYDPPLYGHDLPPPSQPRFLPPQATHMHRENGRRRLDRSFCSVFH